MGVGTPGGGGGSVSFYFAKIDISWALKMEVKTLSLDEKYRFSKTETLLKLYGNLELKFPV